LEKTLGIVLHTIKYSDTSVITKIYTRVFGLRSFIVKGIRSKKSKKLGLLQPFTILEMDVKFTQKSDLGWIKEFNLSFPTHSISTDVIKSSLVFFLAEVLSHTIEQNYQNEDLFDFIREAIIKLEQGNQLANFHLWFLLELSRHYGFYPQNQVNKFDFYFNLVTGVFTNNISSNQQSLSKETSLALQLFLGTVFDDAIIIRLNSKIREELLNALVIYFHIHIEGMKKLKSQEILNTIFS